MAVGSSNDFDLVVLGAGTGGYTAAFRAAQLGLKVALVDEARIGGTCLHRGCIPTKALLESAALAERIRHAGDFGLTLPGEPVVDYPQMAARRDQVVKRMWTGLKTLVDKNKVHWVAGRGRLDGPNKVRISQHSEDGTPGAGGDRVLQATDVILATGSRVKSLPGLEPDGTRIVTSDDVLTMTALPKDIVIVGGGAVGVEFASFFHDVGVKVTLLEYLPAIVPLEDHEVSQALGRSFTRRGMTVMTSARFDPAKVEVTKDGVCLMVGPEGKDPAELRAEMLLVATGRAANIEEIGLETTKVETDKGVVKVNGRMRTKEPHVYAIGDMIGGLWLAHTASHEGIVAAHTIAGDKDVHEIDYVEQPRATYCRPEIASVGLTEQQCKDRGLDYKVGKVPFQAIAKAIIGGEHEGFAKVIGETGTDRTLGIHLVGPHVTDLVAEASLAFTLEAAPWEIGAATHAHPTLSEVLGEAAMAVYGRSINFDAMAVSDGKVRHVGDAVGLTDEQLVEMYRLVALTRALDERMWILNRAGRIPFVISGQGHEGAQVAITWPLRKQHDWVAPFYRSIATCLTFGMSPRDILTAQYATATDPSSGGRQMPGHYGSHEFNLVSVSSPVATQLLHAVGIALAAKVRKTDQVAMTFMGEGSSNQGDVHEGLNFAAIHKLPFVFVVENNGYAISVPAAKEVSVEDVASRAAGYGIPGIVVDGADVLDCYRVAKEAVDRARSGGGPTLIEAKVTRLTGHSSDDQQTKYRSEEELAAEKERDPLPHFRAQLVDAGILTDEILSRLTTDILATVEDATDYAESQPDPDPSTALDWVYAERWPSETPPPWGLGDGPGGHAETH